MKKYQYMQIGIASPEEILDWSFGEVKKHETINYRTLKPEIGGLFCEVIFGPTKDYQCYCGKSRRSGDKGKKCDKCGVELTESKVRRERMGHIELAAPVVHTWYFRSPTSKIATLLDMKSKDVDDIVYLASYIVVDPGQVEELHLKDILSEQEYSSLVRQHGFKFKALTGAEAIKKLLQDINLADLDKELRADLKTATKQRREKIVKRLEVVEAFLHSKNKPEWMVMNRIPVLPPDLRPMVQLDGGRFATTDLNDLYRRILNRNNRLNRQFEQRAPNLITKNEKRMLQEAVDALIDNGKRGKKVVVERNRPLKSLSDLLRGKQGRFRQNLLGKRVDYSGRSVIVVGPDLKMYQCGIPREMALILFKPFIINAIRRRKVDGNEELNTKMGIKKAKEMIDRGDPIAMEELEKIVVEHPVLLNRAPTLHRLGIQAFEPKLVEGKAIRLHPLVTPAFNADFDGDQMAVHVPLSEEAQAEARLLMLASKNILAPKDGKPVVTPSQDMVLGNYYLTIEKAGGKNEGKVFKDTKEVELAYENDEIDFHTRIALPTSAIDSTLFTEKQKNQYIITTYGKIIFNSVFPKGFPYVNEATVENLTQGTRDIYFVSKGQNIKEIVKKLPIVEAFKKRFLSLVISEIFKKFKLAETSKALDRMKDLGFKYSTIAGITVSAYDISVIDSKHQIIKDAQIQIDKYNKTFQRGMMNDRERHKRVVKIWQDAKKVIETDIKEEMNKNSTSNHLFMMADSGARGNVGNFTQLAGMRGIMSSPSGDDIEIPIKSSFREGLTMAEFFISTHGARKGSTDTALKTAESGYLTRRLVDVSHDVTITVDDCGTDKGIAISALLNKDNKEIVPLKDRISGRFTSKAVMSGSKVIIGANELITDEIADEIVKAKINTVEIRNLLTCNDKKGVCVKCYGSDLSSGEVVEKGEVVGIIAAQSIGEPGTQLTMRTFHSGGVAGDDITQGLPRIQELFEAREPKGKAIISEIEGFVLQINEKADNRYEIIIRSKIDSSTRAYLTDSGKEAIVKVGDLVHPGDKLVDGLIHPKELLRVTSVEKVQEYILKEVQKVYRSQGVEISDKHIETIIKQMLQKSKVIDAGDSNLLSGTYVSQVELFEKIEQQVKLNKRPPIAKPALLGITRASLRSDSFLSAASFQETTRVLTEAAIKGKIDELDGLKENIIIGGLIPAGTGLIDQVELQYDETFDTDDALFEKYDS
ncbi:MAG TPA: DNA-directed RNA polymerase subunit beta' [Bacilli bacterium]|nr:DNA-directed RNA polymerase subunit beta' [Bacilli bacterium]